jgi:hypothetical protein
VNDGRTLFMQWMAPDPEAEGGFALSQIARFTIFCPRGGCDAPCPADFNADGLTNPEDFSDFVTCFFLDVGSAGACPGADFNGDSFRNPDDLSDFIAAFFAGC